MVMGGGGCGNAECGREERGQRSIWQLGVSPIGLGLTPQNDPGAGTKAADAAFCALQRRHGVEDARRAAERQEKALVVGHVLTKKTRRWAEAGGYTDIDLIGKLI